MPGKKRDGRGGPRVGSGRPRKKASTKQRHGIGLTVTGAEFRQLEDLADGEPLGTYVRRLVLRHLARKRK